MTDATTTPEHNGPPAGSADADPRAAFVARFAAAWRTGEGLTDLLADDVLLTQPLMPPARGIEAARAQFGALLAAIPDLRGEVLSWGPTGDGVLIELRLRGTLGARAFETVTCDRIVLRDGLVAVRHARMDPVPMLLAARSSPRTALRLLRPAPGTPRPAPPRGARRGATDSALTGLAVGRLALGAASRMAPRATFRAFGAGRTWSGELDYMTRIFGARAVALGSGYLLSRGAARRTWQRLALGVDISDTLAGISQLRAGDDVPRVSRVAMVALTGSYAAVGAAKLARDLIGR